MGGLKGGSIVVVLKAIDVELIFPVGKRLDVFSR